MAKVRTCVGCIVAKKKCDENADGCSRCENLDIKCRYRKGKMSRRQVYERVRKKARKSSPVGYKVLSTKERKLKFKNIREALKNAKVQPNYDLIYIINKKITETCQRKLPILYNKFNSSCLLAFEALTTELIKYELESIFNVTPRFEDERDLNANAFPSDSQ